MNLSPALFRRTTSAWTGGPPRPSPGRSALRVADVDELDLLLVEVAAPAPAMPMLAPIRAHAAIAASARRGVVILISRSSFAGGPAGLGLAACTTRIDPAAKPPVGR